MKARGTFTVSGSEGNPRKVVQVHSSLRTSANASLNVGRDLSYQAARRMVREPSCAICRWAKSVTREKRLNSAGAVRRIAFSQQIAMTVRRVSWKHEWIFAGPQREDSRVG
jgi:hypothetical protein